MKLFSIYMEVSVFCTWLTFDLFLRSRSIYRLGIHPYEFWHMSRNNISISRIMYSKMPTKRKISIFFGFGWPSITSNYFVREVRKAKRSKGALEEHFIQTKGD